jgi:hypothetical protein
MVRSNFKSVILCTFDVVMLFSGAITNIKTPNLSREEVHGLFYEHEN